MNTKSLQSASNKFAAGSVAAVIAVVWGLIRATRPKRPPRPSFEGDFESVNYDMTPGTR